MESVRNPYIYRIYQLCTNICILTFIHSVCYSYIILLALADLSQCNKKSSGGGFHFYFTLSVKLFSRTSRSNDAETTFSSFPWTKFQQKMSYISPTMIFLQKDHIMVSWEWLSASFHDQQFSWTCNYNNIELLPSFSRNVLQKYHSIVFLWIYYWVTGGALSSRLALIRRYLIIQKNSLKSIIFFSVRRQLMNPFGFLKWSRCETGDRIGNVILTLFSELSPETPRCRGL